MTAPTLAERFRAARGDSALAVLEGFHAIKHALRFGGEILEAVAADPGTIAELAAELAPDVAERLGDVIRPIPSDELAALVPAVPATGVVALARRPEVSVSAVLADPSPAPVVFLEAPTHHGNVGAVVRVAAAAGAAGVVTSGGLDPWHPAALRGAAGLHFAVPVARVDDLPACDRSLVALHPEGELLEPDCLPRRAILAFGSERRGLSAELRAGADCCVRIPMRQGVSSLNLATAVAATLYGARPGS